MSRRWWVLGGTSAAVVLAVAGLQLPLAAADPSLPSAAHRIVLPSFHLVRSSHLPAARPSVRPPTASAAGAVVRGVRRPGQAVAAPVTSKDQALSVWTGLPATATSPRPDVSLAVGPKQVLQMSGSGARVITKSTGVAVNSTANLNQLFNVKAGASGFTVSAPTAVYDPIGKRFLIVAATTNNSTNDAGIVVRVSKNSTASTAPSAWRSSYGYLRNDTSTESAPRVGVSADKVVITVNATDTGDPTVAHLTVVLPKQKLYSAGTSGPKAWSGTSDSTFDGQTPVVNASNQKTAFVVVPAAKDFTLISYTGAATSQAPVFVKSVTYSTQTLVDAPNVPQAGGDTITLPPAILTTSASWRSNVLWAAMTVGCTPTGDTTQRACVRVIKMTTAAPATALASQFTIATKGYDSFGPGLGIDTQGSPHVGYSRSNAAASPGAVSAAVVAQTKGGSWTAPLTLTKGTAPFTDGTPGTAAWATRGSASVDPTAPWDVWVAPPLSTSAITAPVQNWVANPSRVSFAKNSAVTSVSAKSVRKGARVTVTAKLLRPNSSEGIKGLPIVLQKKAANGKKWVTVGSVKTDGNGAHKWTLKLTASTDFRTVGSTVKQKNGQGASVVSVTGPAVRVTVKR